LADTTTKENFSGLTWSTPFPPNLSISITKAWVALGKFLPEFVYFAAKICHQGTLPSASPTFPVGKNVENWPKHQGHRSAWVGQADFRKL